MYYLYKKYTEITTKYKHKKARAGSWINIPWFFHHLLGVSADHLCGSDRNLLFIAGE